MSKRSAVAIAAILVGAMALGGFAMSLGVAGPTSAAAKVQPRTERIVEVRRRTITVHRKADAAPSAAIATTLTLPAGSDDDQELEDGFEHEDDDGSEHEVEHEDDGFEVEDD
jgi:hypothetical protein